ncbi:MAG: hypothetical protein J6A57_02955 [Ruminococcus sp.]|nr:hypothetical protein [Ruminococcus sp.]
MEFTFLKKYLEDNCISLREAGAMVGRSGTAIKAWCDGNGLADRRVRAKIAKIMGVDIKIVDAEVEAYVKRVYRASKKIKTERIAAVCDEFRLRLSVAVNEEDEVVFNDSISMKVIDALIGAIKVFDKVK